jgi:hypothetical protein
MPADFDAPSTFFASSIRVLYSRPPSFDSTYMSTVDSRRFTNSERRQTRVKM